MYHYFPLCVIMISDNSQTLAYSIKKSKIVLVLTNFFKINNVQYVPTGFPVPRYYQYTLID